VNNNYRVVLTFNINIVPSKHFFFIQICRTYIVIYLTKTKYNRVHFDLLLIVFCSNNYSLFDNEYGKLQIIVKKVY